MRFVMMNTKFTVAGYYKIKRYAHIRRRKCPDGVGGWDIDGFGNDCFWNWYQPWKTGIVDVRASNWEEVSGYRYSRFKYSKYKIVRQFPDWLR